MNKPGSRSDPLVVSASAGPIPPELIAVTLLIAAPAVGVAALAGISLPGVLQAVLTILLLIGVWTGRPLAWWSAMILSTWAGVFGAVSAIQYLVNGHLTSGSMMALMAVDYLAIPLLLHRDRCRKHFDLQCPQCGYLKTTGADLLFTMHRCKRCGVHWITKKGATP